jgi:hypothetical protein
MAEIFRSTVRARGLRAAPLVLGAMLAATAFTMGWIDGRPNLVAVILLATTYAIVNGAGLIGNDIADGTVQLLLARPITRNGYLAGRFLGAVTLAVAGGLLLLASNAAGTLLHSGGGFEWAIVGSGAFALVTRLVWQVALCFAFSTFVPGRGDAVTYLALVVMGLVLAGQANDVEWPWLAAAFHWVAGQIRNGLTPSGGSPAFWLDLSRWSSNVGLALLLGAAVFHTREFSYGAG